MAAKTRHGGGRAGSFFMILGCLAVLGSTFMLGVAAGRGWPGLASALLGAGATAKPGRNGSERPARAQEPPPRVTFYQELTAPLAASPATKPAKPARAETAGPARAEPAKPSPAPRGRPEPTAPAAAADSHVATDGRFTVQVAAYTAREPAEALRARLAARGVEAYVVEGEGPGGTRYRVRVGAFPTREAAKEAAARLTAERSLATFVTTR